MCVCRAECMYIFCIIIIIIVLLLFSLYLIFVKAWTGPRCIGNDCYHASEPWERNLCHHANESTYSWRTHVYIWLLSHQTKKRLWWVIKALAMWFHLILIHATWRHLNTEFETEPLCQQYLRQTAPLIQVGLNSKLFEHHSRRLPDKHMLIYSASYSVAHFAPRVACAR